MLFDPAFNKTWPPGVVVQVVVAGSETCDPPAPFNTMDVNLSPYGPL